MIRQQSGKTVTKYFGRLKAEPVNAELSKGNLTKHEELNKTERDDRNTANPDRMVERKILPWISLNLLTLEDKRP